MDMDALSPEGQAYVDSYTPSMESQDVIDFIGRRRLRIQNGQDSEKDPEKFTPQEDQRMKWPSNEECVVVYAAAEKKARKFWERLEGSDKKQKIMTPAGIAVSGANAKEATPVTTEQLVGTDPVEGPPLPFTLEADDKE